MTGIMKAIGLGPPKMPTPIRMPDPESAVSRQAAYTKATKRKKKGREGTIYSDAAYTGTSLGGGS